jgi:glycosyltransferase involved in cell wall biosynthesis
VERFFEVTPSVAVITPTLPERSGFLAECMGSVAAQTVPATVHLVGVDLERRGPVAVRNELALAADTDWLAFLDDDDLFLPNHLEVLLSVADCNVDVVWSLCEVTGRPGWSVPHFCYGWKLKPGGQNFIPITALVRRSTFVGVGGFPDVPWSEDFALWLKMQALGAGFRCVHETTWVYRFHGGNRSMT